MKKTYKRTFWRQKDIKTGFGHTIAVLTEYLTKEDKCKIEYYSTKAGYKTEIREDDGREWLKGNGFVRVREK